jgi:hypothetical protein
LGLRLVIHGTDDAEGRGLLVLSALAHLVDELTDIEIRVVCGDDPVIRTAVECSSWNDGLDISVAPAGSDLGLELEGAALFVAVVTRSKDALPLAAVHAARVPPLIAVQFAGPDMDAPTLSLVRAAHDPRVLARAIADRLALLQ